METFIQPKIVGYRQLSSEEAALMNEAKELGNKFQSLIERIRNHHKHQRTSARFLAGPEGNENDSGVAEMVRLDTAEPERWLAEGRTDIQKGIMSVVRSVAQPASF